jgi:hypothetical protein
MQFSECRLVRKATPHGEETSIEVDVDVGPQTLTIKRSTRETDRNFLRFLEELDRFLELAVTEEIAGMRTAWAPTGSDRENIDEGAMRSPLPP